MSYPPTPGPDVVAGLDFGTPNTAPAGPDVVVPIVFGAGAEPDEAPIVITGRFAFGGSVLANVDAGVHRGVSQQTALPFGPAQALPVQTAAPWDQSQALPVKAAQQWQPAEPLHQQTAAPWTDTERQTQCARAAWSNSPTEHAQTTALWAQAAVQRLLRAVAWDTAQDAGTRAVIRWDEATYTRHTAELPWQQARAAGRETRAPWDKRPTASTFALIAPWDVAQALHTCRSGPVYVRPAPPVIPPDAETVALRFCALYAAHPASAVPIVFGLNPCGWLFPTAPLYILPARYYMAVHSLTAALLPSLEPVPITDLNISADVGSWGWTFSASGPASLFDALTPVSGLPRSIRFTLDGLQWSFLIDQVQRSEAFGQRGVKFSGRSLTALVAAPYAREAERLNTSPADAQQLAAQALDLTGIGLDWGIQDWLVPTGAWSHTGTPLDAVAAIAEAAGGYLQSARNAPTLLVRHPYPLLPGGVPGGPWNWYHSGVDPDVELALDSLITTGIERRDGPDINSVYVSGTTQGVLAWVKRTGTAGEKLAPLITDPLITHATAAQQRGLSVLGAAGPKHWVSLDLPVLTGDSQPGVLDVGQLVQVNAAQPWRGRVRSVSARAAFGAEVRQTVTLERHLEVAP